MWHCGSREREVVVPLIHRNCYHDLLKPTHYTGRYNDMGAEGAMALIPALQHLTRLKWLVLECVMQREVQRNGVACSVCVFVRVHACERASEQATSVRACDFLLLLLLIAYQKHFEQRGGVVLREMTSGMLARSHSPLFNFGSVSLGCVVIWRGSRRRAPLVSKDIFRGA